MYSVENGSEPSPCTVQHVYWQGNPEASRNANEELLTAIASTCEIEVEAPASSDAICEFTENDFLIMGAFPDVFFLGRGAQRGSVSEEHRRSWMMHHNRRARTNAQLLFLLFDQMQRHATCKTVKAKVSAFNTGSHFGVQRFSCRT